MGIITQGDALSAELGPSLGRGLGMAADADRATSNLVASGASPAQAAGQAPTGHEHHTQPAARQPGQPEPFDPLKDMYPKDDPEKKKIQVYPQDMWMVEYQKYSWKPETYGLRPGWTGAMMGMMSIVRVVTPEVYDKIMDLKAENPKPPQQPGQPAHQHGA